MDSYEALAAAYDELTEDVEYEKRADFVEKLFLRAKRPVRSLLDLACGTGTMTELFARRGYTVTGVDYSPEMLAQAQQKLAAIDPPPLLLCQSMPQLRLLDSVDAAICCLDSINYLTRPRDVQRTFNRLHDTIAPGGSLVFDIHAVSKMEKLDGEVRSTSARTCSASGARATAKTSKCSTTRSTSSASSRMARGSATLKSTTSAPTRSKN